jgi:ABC-type uncharacterized transport system substrate-binding protein
MHLGVAVLVLLFVASLLTAEAEQAGKSPRIGLLDYAPFWGEPLREGLRDLGYVENQNISFAHRPSEGRSERLPKLASELVRLKVDVIVAYGTPASQAAKQATATIPIVMLGIGDPVRAGLILSLGRPGGNVTGNTIQGPELTSKRLQLLREALPRVSRVAFLWNPLNASNAVAFQEAMVGTRALGMTLHSIEVRSPDRFESAFAAMRQERPDALVMTADPMLLLHVERVVNFAARNRLPVMYQVKGNVMAGGLMSYGPSLPDLSRRGALYVDRILKGAKPAELPVEQATTFELVVNLKTAKALGLTIPSSLLQRADQVIE